MSVGLYLMIGKTAYVVDKVAPRAWRLTKSAETSYVVSVGQWGPACECPDFEARRKHAGTLCKHLKAALGKGLL